MTHLRAVGVYLSAPAAIYIYELNSSTEAADKILTQIILYLSHFHFVYCSKHEDHDINKMYVDTNSKARFNHFTQSTQINFPRVSF